jgi:hypothetical protein
VFPVGGVGVMLLGIAVSGAACAGLAVVLARRTGTAWAWSLALLLWSLAAIGFLTLIPADGAPGVVYADERYYNSCSFDYGGPAPEGFWILSGGQRLLNTVVFVPSGALLVLVLGRWRSAWWTVPLGLVGLGLVSVGIEATQQVLSRLDRSCDVTDVVDNLAGAGLGVLAGIVLLPLVRPWRGRRGRSGPRGAAPTVAP